MTVESAPEGRPGGLDGEWPVSLVTAVAWGDMDAYQHVNNTRYFRWFEDVRIELFGRTKIIDHQKSSGIGPILARTECIYRHPLTFPDQLIVSARISEIGDDRFTIENQIYSESAGKICALGSARMVMVDYRAGGKAPIPADVRDSLAELRPASWDRP
ncbi:MAG TPA: acyl-CoA thioesterase [Planctomycetes bacterium]|nr:acyl-CoA thioesterase [Planctomycetota bacterium]HIN80926.1 acyl-CoA thioesterase [Planctomycetota bacterium]